MNLSFLRLRNFRNYSDLTCRFLLKEFMFCMEKMHKENEFDRSDLLFKSFTLFSNTKSGTDDHTWSEFFHMMPGLKP